MAKKSNQVVRAVDQLGNIRYTKNGKLHREDGPAVIYTNGMQIWYKNGKWHREDGPAILCFDGSQIWYKDGKHIKTSH